MVVQPTEGTDNMHGAGVRFRSLSLSPPSLPSLANHNDAQVHPLIVEGVYCPPLRGRSAAVGLWKRSSLSQPPAKGFPQGMGGCEVKVPS